MEEIAMRIFLLLMCAVLLFTGCSSYTATGAYVGGQFGHVIGSAIGSISGGRRGYDMGTVIGTVGGIAAGAAVGAAVEKAQEHKYNERMEQQYPPREYGNDTGYQNRQPANNGQYDDRITFDGEGVPGTYPADIPSYTVAELSRKAPLEVRNALILDSDKDGVLTRGERCTVQFEIMNNTHSTVYDIYPLVEDVTANTHVKVSPNLRVECIAPFSGVRYTATIVADKKLKDGEIVVEVGVAQGDNVIESQMKRFKVVTRKKAEQ